MAHLMLTTQIQRNALLQLQETLKINDWKLPLQIENAIYKYATNYFETEHLDTKRKYYCQKTRSILFNLKHNPELTFKVKSGSISPQTLVNMSHDELNPEIRRKYFEKLKYQESEKRHTSNGLVHCPKCRSKNTTHFQLQTRRADEGMTVFYKCENCENRWKTN